MNGTPEPAVTLVILARGTRAQAIRCLTAAVKGAGSVPHRLLLVDDTADESCEALARVPGLKLLKTGEPRGEKAGKNAGASLATTPFVVFLDADTEPHPGWLLPLVKVALSDEHVAAVGSRLLAPTGLVEADGIEITEAPSSFVAANSGEPALPLCQVSEVAAASAASLLVRRHRFLSAGAFDLGVEGLASDIDLCLRLREGRGSVLLARASVAVHQASRPLTVSDPDAARLLARFSALGMPRGPGAVP